MPLIRWAVTALLLFAAGSGRAAADEHPPGGFLTDFQGNLRKYCGKCHGPNKPKGDLNLLSDNSVHKAFKEQQKWANVLVRFREGDMPPPGSPRPNEEESVLLEKWFEYLSKPPKKGDCDQLATDGSQHFYRGHVMGRRLTRAEYQNTIRDLLGVAVDVTSLPSDGSGGEGFDTTGDTLYLSTIHLERYLDLAGAAVRASAVTEPPPQRRREAAREELAAFLPRAFRRPVNDDEINRYLSVFDRADQRGDGYAAAIRLARQAALISPNFLFLIEPIGDREGVLPLDDYPLASRLSYFLWSSMPDEELLRGAGEGRLQDPEELRRQVRRMLADPKSRALAENFAPQWLGLNELGTARRPDPGRFPEFRDDLAFAMRQEVIAVFDAIIRENRPVTELIAADWTIVNDQLANLYGIADVTGPEFRRLRLSDPRRGGLLTTAAVLTVTSQPLRTSPVLRGKWVLEELLGSRVPPPPPGAGELPPDDRAPDGLTLKQRLEHHRTKPDCAGCHNRMDPLGFGLENFDPIGRWRDRQNDEPIDATGQLPNGDRFDGPAELKQLLLRRKGEFGYNLTKKLYGYALGRSINPFDDCAIRESFKALETNGYKPADMIEQIVLSYPFRHRYHKP